MNSLDHQELKSTDHNPGSRDHREAQLHHLEQGQFGDAWTLDVSDIRSKFETKYDEHIVQAESYLLKLDAANKIQLEQTFKAELEKRQELQKEIDTKRAEIETGTRQEQENKLANLRELEARRAESFEKNQREVDLKRSEYEAAARKEQEEKVRIEKNAEDQQVDKAKREAEEKSEAVVWKLRLTNEMGESKVIFYQFNRGETRPELTQEIKEQLWNIPEKTVINRQTIDTCQQQISTAQKPPHLTQNHSYQMGI